MRRLFKTFDLDKSGYLDKEEIQSVRTCTRREGARARARACKGAVRLCVEESRPFHKLGTI